MSEQELADLRSQFEVLLKEELQANTDANNAAAAATATGTAAAGTAAAGNADADDK